MAITADNTLQRLRAAIEASDFNAILKLSLQRRADLPTTSASSSNSEPVRS